MATHPPNHLQCQITRQEAPLLRFFLTIHQRYTFGLRLWTGDGSLDRQVSDRQLFQTATITPNTVHNNNGADATGEILMQMTFDGFRRFLTMLYDFDDFQRFCAILNKV